VRTTPLRHALAGLQIVALAALAASGAAGAQAAGTLAAGDLAKIDSAITAVMTRSHIPALSIAIVLDDEVRWQRGYGTADLENGVAASESTVYRIASTSKALTAVAAMQLAERGALDLDAPIQRYAPGFPRKPFPITTRQLLAHMSGIRHYKPREPERTEHYEKLSDALAIFATDSLEHEPGARFTYTTFGYTLLGVVIEGASGMPYADYMRTHVFEPARMRHTQADDPAVLIPNRAAGYSPRVYGRFDGSFRNATLLDASYKLPGGGWLSTAEDLARFAIALERGVLLEPKTIQQMWAPQRARDGRETGYGYGWYLGKREGARPDRMVWHGGVQPGCTSELRLVPERHFAVAILTNLEGGGRLGLGALASQIANIVLE